MTTNFIDKKKIQELKEKLEGANEVMEHGHIKIIKDTSKELIDLFTKPDNVVDFSLKNDIQEIKDVLEKRKETLASKKSIKKSEISSNYEILFHPDTGKNIDPSDIKRIELRIKDLYENKLMKYVKNTFPVFADFRTNIRKNITYKINDLEKTGKADATNLKNIYDALEKNHIFLSSSSPEIKQKLTRLIVLFSQVDYFLEKGQKQNQLEQANKILEKIRLVFKQLEAYEATEKAIESIKKREKVLEGLETTTPKNVAKTTPNKTTKTGVMIELKDHFLDKTKGLDELPEGYEIKKLQLKDAKNKEIEIFEDVTGKPFEKTLKKGESTEIFVKDETGGYKKLGTISIPTSTPTTLQIELEAYQDLPRPLAFPAKIAMEATGIGGKGKKITDKVAITKTIDIQREKPYFSKEYDSLDTLIHYKEKLEKMYNDMYEMALEDQLNKFFTNHEDESIRNGWKKLSDEEKRTFFIDVIQSNAHPIRGAGITNINKVRKKNVLTLIQFQNAFKEAILKGFTGKTDMHLKEYILEKLGTEPWTKENPTYAQGLLGEKIMEVYQKPDEKRALWMAINKFLLGIEDGSISKAGDEVLYPDLPDIRGTKELTASVADVEAISEEQARNQAIEEFTRSYQASMKRSLRRARMFFFRTRIINNKIKKLMKETSNKLLTDEETTSAVNRWMIKKELNMEGANKIKVETTVFNDPVFQTKINNIINEYLQENTTWTKEAFEREINELINNNHELKVYMEKNNITHIGSNIIERVEFEKEQRKYYKDIIDITEKYTSGQIKTREDYDKQIREKIGEFAEKQKRLPDLVKELNLDINARDFVEKLRKHKNALERMRNRTVSMRLNMLVNAKPKQEPKGLLKKFMAGVQKDERGLTTAQHIQIDKLGGRGKFYRWIEQHPRWTALGTTAGLVGTAMIPVVGVGIGASMLFVLNYLKKRGHYTKEHVKFEKELLAMTPEQRDKYLKEMKEEAEKKPEWLRKVFPTKYDKYGASMEYLNKTQAIQLQIENIRRYTSTGKILSPAEMDSLREYTIKAIATLALQEKEGRNFTYSKTGQENIEQLYNELYTTILGALGRIDSTKNPVDTYTRIKSDITRHRTNILKQTDYKTDKAKMQSMRNRLGIYAGSKAAAIYLGTARLIGQIREGWDSVFGGHETTTTETIRQIQIDEAIKKQIQSDLGRMIDFNNISPADQVDIINWFKNHGYHLNDATNEIYKIVTTPGGVKLDDAFGPNGQDLLHKVFDGDAAKFEAFKEKISALQPGDKSSTLRGTMKDIYGTNELATEKTRTFFENFGNKIIENGQHELIKLTTNSPLSADGAEKIAQKMAEWYGNSGMLNTNELYTVTNPEKIKELFDGFANGTYTLNNLPDGWNLQTASDVLHCKYAGFGDGLKEYIFDIGNEHNKQIIGKIITDTTITGGGGGLRNFNRFGVPTFRNEINNFKENNNK